MSITGAADDDGGEPTKVGVAISDVVTGMLGAVGVLAALLGRERGPAARPAAASGSTCRSSASTLASLVNQAQNAFVTGARPGRRGNAHPNIVPYETFATADGEIAIAVGSSASGRGSATRSGCRPWPTIRGSPRTAIASSTAPSCGRSSPSGSATGTTAEWLAALEAAEIPCGPINDIVEAFASPEARALGMAVELEHPAWGVIRQVGIPFELSATPASIRRPPPLLGAGHRRDPGGARLRRGRDRGPARRGVV